MIIELLSLLVDMFFKICLAIAAVMAATTYSNNSK
jgi:hypothetical protein